MVLLLTLLSNAVAFVLVTAVLVGPLTDQQDRTEAQLSQSLRHHCCASGRFSPLCYLHMCVVQGKSLSWPDGCCCLSLSLAVSLPVTASLA